VSVARVARPDDAADVIRLASIMYGAMGLDVSGSEWRENAERMIQERNDSDDCAVFVVDDDERIVSCGGVTVATRLPGPGVPTAKYGYIQWMVTDPVYRRRGHARAVFEALLGWLRDHGVRNAELHATREGEPLYRSYGFDDPRYPQLRAGLEG
jgi:GNAT superfamily N-acetyltransferase